MSTPPHPSQPGIIVGMRAEARILAGTGLAVAIGGGKPQGAAAAAQRLIADGCNALLSIGLAGGLDPALNPGAKVVPAAVLHDGACYPTDPALAAQAGGVTALRLLAADTAVAKAADKSALFATTGAAAVDLESGAVALAAKRGGIPFAALRVVCDPAWRDLPPASLAALDSHGNIVLAPLLAALLRHPGQLPDLLKLAGDARMARRALRVAVAAFARTLGER